MASVVPISPIDPESRFYVVWKWSYADAQVTAVPDGELVVEVFTFVQLAVIIGDQLAGAWPNAVSILVREKTGTHVVAEVARLRGFTPNTRILANSATRILNGAGRGPRRTVSKRGRHPGRPRMA